MSSTISPLRVGWGFSTLNWAFRRFSFNGLNSGKVIAIEYYAENPSDGIRFVSVAVELKLPPK